MNDTTDEAEEVRLRALRAMGPTKRLAMALGWSTSVRALTREGLRRQFPGCTERELHRRMAERLLGAELAMKVYGPSDAHG